MKAMITTTYGSPDVFRLENVAKPVPHPNQVLIKVHASAVTKADTMMRTGKPFIGRLFTGLSKPKLPVWGTGFSGVVEAVGSKVTQFKVGSKIFGENIETMGTYAEYVTVPEDGIVAHLPDNISFDEAAGMCDGGLTSLNFLVSLGKKLGADHVIDYTREDFTSANSRYNLIYDTVGVRSFTECRPALTKHGLYLSPVLGMPLMGHMMVTSVFGQKKAKFSATGVLPVKETRRLLDMLLDIIEAGNMRGILDRAYPLEQLAEAHRYVDAGHKKGNVTLNPII